MNRIVFLLCLMSFSSFGNTHKNTTENLQKYSDVRPQYKTSQFVGYGESFDVEFTAIRKKDGKQKKIRPGNMRFSTKITGGTVHANTITVTNRPTNKDLCEIKVFIEQKRFLKDPVVYTFTYPIDFSKRLYIDFSGHGGRNGKRGSNRWGKPLIGRDGGDGGPGGDGGNGTNGKSLSVKINSEFDKNLGYELFFIYVTEKVSKTEYVYRWVENPGGVIFDVHGGAGGNGGNGGRGGNGKDGEYVTKKNGDVVYKEAGRGGNGGSGGDGGNGGNGGKIEMTVHENAVGITAYITCILSGGSGGSGGSGHDHYGGAGSALEGKWQPGDGHPGNHGQSGFYGEDGKFSMQVKSF